MKRIVSMVTAGALIATLIVPANVVSTQAKVKKQTISLTVGAVKKLQVNKSFAKKNVKWKSSNKSVVTVNKSGKIKAVSVGKANVTAKTTGKKGQLAAKFVIKVTKKKVESTTAPATTTAPQVTQTPVATQTPVTTQSAAPQVTQTPAPTTTPTQSPNADLDISKESINLIYTTAGAENAAKKLEAKASKNNKAAAVAEKLKSLDDEYFQKNTVALVGVPVTDGYDVTLTSTEQKDQDMVINLQADWTAKDGIVTTVIETQYVLVELPWRLPGIDTVTTQLTYHNDMSSAMDGKTVEVCKIKVESLVWPEN